MKLKKMFFQFVVLVSAQDCKRGTLGIKTTPCRGTTKNIKCDYGVAGQYTTVCCEKSDGWVAVGTGSGMWGEAVWKEGTKSGTIVLTGHGNIEMDDSTTSKSGKIELVDRNGEALCFSMKTPSSKKNVVMQWAMDDRKTLTTTDFPWQQFKKHSKSGTFELDLTNAKGGAAVPATSDSGAEGVPATNDSEVTTPERAEPEDGDDSNTFMIVAAAGGGGLLLAIVVIVVYCCYFNKPKKEEKEAPFAQDQNKKKANVSITSLRREPLE